MARESFTGDVPLPREVPPERGTLMPNVSLHEPGFTVEYWNQPVAELPLGFTELLSVADEVVTSVGALVVTVGGRSVNVAVTELFAVMANVQEPVPVHDAPDHPANVEPPEGVAVRVMDVPLMNDEVQVPVPQDILPDTLPVPVPAMVTERE